MTLAQEHMVAGPDAMVVGLFDGMAVIAFVIMAVVVMAVVMALVVVIMVMIMRMIVTVEGMVVCHASQSSALPL